MTNQIQVYHDAVLISNQLYCTDCSIDVEHDESNYAMIYYNPEEDVELFIGTCHKCGKEHRVPACFAAPSKETIRKLTHFLNLGL